ncbi:hypothetical protein [Dendrosporobacter sp. 1207_IL3150]|uniref:hypothetical protein n=1 Tax=Dendrosporobacter sp. 1207_IL3150 TaxID=3084054 RepID=UPI002FD8EE19
MEPIAVKEKIIDISSKLKQSDLDADTREQLMAELVKWCEQYFALYNKLKAVPKLALQ